MKKGISDMLYVKAYIWGIVFYKHISSSYFLWEGDAKWLSLTTKYDTPAFKYSWKADL